MSFWNKKTKTDLSREQECADRVLEQETKRFAENREVHHNLISLSPLDTLRAYVILAERRGK